MKSAWSKNPTAMLQFLRNGPKDRSLKDFKFCTSVLYLVSHRATGRTHSIGPWPAEIDGYPESVTSAPGIDAKRGCQCGVLIADARAHFGLPRQSSTDFGVTWGSSYLVQPQAADYLVSWRVNFTGIELIGTLIGTRLPDWVWISSQYCIICIFDYFESTC